MNKYRFILASGSPRRKELLEQVGINFTVVKSDADENVSEKNPKVLVKKLALLKAMEVYQKKGKRLKNPIVIGADTIVSVDGEILGKPKDEDEAFDMIERIAGRSHEVYTGVALVGHEKTIVFAVKTKVYVYPMTKEQILEYIKTGEPMDKAGAYGIQGRFAAYIKKIDGDYNNVVGLPVGKLCKVLRGWDNE